MDTTQALIIGSCGSTKATAAQGFMTWHVVLTAFLFTYLIVYNLITCFEPSFVVTSTSDYFHQDIAEVNGALHPTVNGDVLTQRGRNAVFLWSLVVALVVAILAWIVTSQQGWFGKV